MRESIFPKTPTIARSYNDFASDVQEAGTKMSRTPVKEERYYPNEHAPNNTGVYFFRRQPDSTESPFVPLSANQPQQVVSHNGFVQQIQRQLSSHQSSPDLPVGQIIPNLPPTPLDSFPRPTLHCLGYVNENVNCLNCSAQFGFLGIPPQFLPSTWIDTTATHPHHSPNSNTRAAYNDVPSMTQPGSQSSAPQTPQMSPQSEQRTITAREFQQQAAHASEVVKKRFFKARAEEYARKRACGELESQQRGLERPIEREDFSNREDEDTLHPFLINQQMLSDQNETIQRQIKAKTAPEVACINDVKDEDSEWLMAAIEKVDQLVQREGWADSRLVGIFEGQKTIAEENL